MYTLTWREKAVRLAGAAIVAAGVSLAVAAPSAAATPPPKPGPGTEHGRADDHPGRGQPGGKSRPGHGDDGKDAGGGKNAGTRTADPAGPPPSSAPAAPDEQRGRGESRNGDNGTVKVHRSTTPADDRRNEPKVCSFYLVGFGFDPDQQVSWHIRSWPPTGDRAVVADGALVLDDVGHGRTADLSLPDGHYKLFWNFEGEKGRAKHKVFWVRCPAESPSPSPSPSTAVPTPTGTAPGAEPPAEKPAQPAPPADERGGRLPFTGFPAWLAAALALALLAGGTTMVVAARRRAH